MTAREQWEHDDQRTRRVAVAAAMAKALEASTDPDELRAIASGDEAVIAAVIERPTDALADCEATFRKWLHLPDGGGLYVTLATVAANRAAGDPVWLLMVAPPGGGKTEILHPLARLPDVYPAGTLTEAALLSGTPKRERAQGAKGGLLREIGDFGIILHKDFGSVLSMHREQRAQVLAALREIYDGSWTRYVGTDGGRTLSWSGKVGLIAGCTPAIDGHHAVIGSMGERFAFYRLPAADADAQARQALDHIGSEHVMRDELGDVVGRVLAGVGTAQLLAPADEATKQRLVKLSTLAVRCRSAVERDGYTREVVLIPEPEAPARLALVLLRLLNALLAIGVGRMTAWHLVTKCALDSMPAIRRTIAEELMRRTTVASTAEIAEQIAYPTNTTRRALEDLTAHGIAERMAQGAGRADLWQASAWARGRWPTVPEMSGGFGTVPEMSDKVADHAQNNGEAAPLTLPLPIEEDFSGTVPDPEDDAA